MGDPQHPSYRTCDFRSIYPHDLNRPEGLSDLCEAFTKNPNATDLEKRISSIIIKLTTQFKTSTASLPYLLRRLQIVPVPLELKYNIHNSTEMCIQNVDDVMGKLEEVYAAFFATVEDVCENNDDLKANPLLLRRPSINEVQNGEGLPFYKALRSLLIAVCGGDAQVSYERSRPQIDRNIDLCMQYLKIIAEANDDLSMWIQEFAVETNGTAYKSRFSPVTRKNEPEVYFMGPPNLNHTILDLYVRLVVASGGWYKTTQYNMQQDEMLMLTMNKDLMCVTAFIHVLTRVVQNSSMQEPMELGNQNSTLSAKSQASSSVENAKHTPSKPPLLCVLMPSEVDRAWKTIKDGRKQGTLDSLITFKDVIEHLLTELRVGVYPMGEISLNGTTFGGYFPAGASDTEESDQKGEQEGEQETDGTEWGLFSTIKPDMLRNLRNLEPMLNLFVEFIRHPCSMCTSGEVVDPLCVPTVCLLRCNNVLDQNSTLAFPHKTSNPVVLCGQKNVCALQFCMGGLCPYGVTGFCKECFKLSNVGEVSTGVNKLQSALDDVYVGGNLDERILDEQKATAVEKAHFEPICEKGRSCNECAGLYSQLNNRRFAKRQSSALARHVRSALPLDPRTKPPATERVGERNPEEVRDPLKAHFPSEKLNVDKGIFDLFVRSKDYLDDCEGDPLPVDDRTKGQSADLKRKRQDQENRVKGMEYLTSVATHPGKDSADDWNKLSVQEKFAKLKSDADLWLGISSDIYKAIGERVSDGMQ
jgi:hypothetical protein